MNPLMIVALCYLSDILEIHGLPDFIDRGAACKWLMRKGYAKKQTDKHVHGKSCLILKNGERLIRRLRNRGFLQIVNSCRFDSRENFIKDFEDQIEVLKEQAERVTQYPSDSIFDHFPPMQEWHVSSRRLNLRFLVDNWQQKNDSIFEIYLQVVCPNCRKRSSYSYIFDLSDQTMFWIQKYFFCCNWCSRNYEHNFCLRIWREGN